MTASKILANSTMIKIASECDLENITERRRTFRGSMNLIAIAHKVGKIMG
jgi:hypothetical protein